MELIPRTTFFELPTYDVTLSKDGEIFLTVVNEVDTYLMPVISIILAPLLIVCIWKTTKSKKEKESGYEYVALYY